MYLTPGEDMQHASSFQEMPRKFKRHHFDSHQMFFHFVNLVGIVDREGEQFAIFPGLTSHCSKS